MSNTKNKPVKQNSLSQSLPNRKNYFLIYTALFVLMCVLVYCHFFIAGKSFVFNDDGWKQHFKAMVYYGRWLRTIAKNILVNHVFEIPSFSFSIGYGSDIMTTLHYYVIGDPLTVFSALIPTSYMVYFYSFLILLRLYLAGAAFSCYCFYRRNSGIIPTLIGAISYVFCGFALFAAVRHPYFANPMIYLPLLLLGVEKIFQDKKPWLFIGMVFISAVSSFYFFYMLVLLTVLYVLFRIVMLYSVKEWKHAVTAILQFGGYAIIGVLLSSVMLFPILRLFSTNSRSSVPVVYSMLYPDNYYKNFLFGFVTHLNIGSWSILGYSVIILLSVFTLFLCRKKYTALKVSFLLLTSFLLLPVVGHVFNGFSYVCNRWIWGYSMLLAYIMVVMWDELWNLSEIKKVLLCILTGLFYLYCFRLNKDMNKYDLILTFLFSLLCLAMLFFSKIAHQKWKKTVFELSLLCVTIANIACTAYYEYAPSKSLVLDEFMDPDTVTNGIYNSEAIAITATGDKGEFFRYSGDVYNATNANSTLSSGLSSVQFYWSLSNNTIAPFMKDLCLLDNSTYNYKKLDNRTALNTLAGVKYYIISAHDPGYPAANYVPYGFEFCPIEGNAANQYTVYQNQNTLPLGYTYSSCLSSSSYESLSALQKQEALLQCIVLDEIPDGFDNSTPSLTSQELTYQTVCNGDDIIQSEHTFTVNKRNASITLIFEGLPFSETYLFLKGLTYKGRKGSGPSETVLSVNSVNTEGNYTFKDLYYRTPRYTWYVGRHDFAVNMCYDEFSKTSITVTFPATGIYSFDEMKVLCQPMENYTDQVAALRENVLENTNLHNDNTAFATNEVTGHISLDQAKILCLTIPYSDGWKAYVDGEATELLNANTMYMALPLSSGEHEIRLIYHTPGKKSGFLLTLLGLTLLAGLMYASRTTNKRPHLQVHH